MTESFEIGLGNNDTETRVRAQEDFVSFWEDQASRLTWFRRWSVALDWQPPFARWFRGGRINAAYNALDVHQEKRASKIAILWEGEDGKTRRITYGELYDEVRRVSNALRSLGVCAGRQGGAVPAYDPGTSDIHAGMRQNRGGAHRSILWI